MNNPPSLAIESLKHQKGYVIRNLIDAITLDPSGQWLCIKSTFTQTGADDQCTLSIVDTKKGNVLSDLTLQATVISIAWLDSQLWVTCVARRSPPSQRFWLSVFSAPHLEELTRIFLPPSLQAPALQGSHSDWVLIGGTGRVNQQAPDTIMGVIISRSARQIIHTLNAKSLFEAAMRNAGSKRWVSQAVAMSLCPDGGHLALSFAGRLDGDNNSGQLWFWDTQSPPQLATSQAPTTTGTVLWQSSDSVLLVGYHLTDGAIIMRVSRDGIDWECPESRWPLADIKTNTSSLLSATHSDSRDKCLLHIHASQNGPSAIFEVDTRDGKVLPDNVNPSLTMGPTCSGYLHDRIVIVYSPKPGSVTVQEPPPVDQQPSLLPDHNHYFEELEIPDLASINSLQSYSTNHCIALHYGSAANETQHHGVAWLWP